MYHASATFANYLFIHGGLNTDDKGVYEDSFVFDISERQWVELVVHTPLDLGNRYMHSMNTVIPRDVEISEQNWNTVESGILDTSKIGIYMFGGYKDGVESNDLILIRPVSYPKTKGKFVFQN
jgi:hypothetical protein